MQGEQGPESGPELGSKSVTRPAVAQTRTDAKNMQVRVKGQFKRQFTVEDLDVLNKNWIECLHCERKRLSLLGGTLERHLRSNHGFKFGEAVDYCTDYLRPAIEARLEASYFRPLEHKGGLIKDLSNMKDDLNPSISGVNQRQLINLRKRHGRKLWFERWKMVSKSLTKKQMESFASLAVEKYGSTSIRQGLDHFKPRLYAWEKVLEENPNYLMIGQDDKLRE